MTIGLGVALAAAFITAGGFGVAVINVRKSKGGNNNGKYVREVTCMARVDGIKDLIKQVDNKVDQLLELELKKKG